MVQNLSHAVMAQRHEAKDSLDDFPTPPWATRALLEHVLKHENTTKMSCLEPACNKGHMSRVLKEYFFEVESSDVHDYGYGSVKNFLNNSYKKNSFDWIITNPPFRLAEEFLNKANYIASTGIALLARTVFLESVGRYDRIFKNNPPAYFAQFSERVPMVKGRLDKKASTATGYAWFVWKLKVQQEPKLIWIPPCRKILERDEDYDESSGLELNENINQKNTIQSSLL
tara:strand:+ start:120 stop:803 length:684 start_codon:yes stop_codon:yes gene_type:complete